MKAKAIRTISTTPADSGTDRNMPSGMSGSATLVSQKANRAKSRAAPPRKPQVLALPQPHDSPALMIPQMREAMAPESRRMPGRSKDLGAFSARWSRRITRPETRATTSSGTLMKNTDCQLTCSTRRPPTVGPPAVEAPMTMPQICVYGCCQGPIGRDGRRAAVGGRFPGARGTLESAAMIRLQLLDGHLHLVPGLLGGRRMLGHRGLDGGRDSEPRLPGLGRVVASLQLGAFGAGIALECD